MDELGKIDAGQKTSTETRSGPSEVVLVSEDAGKRLGDSRYHLTKEKR